jgi:hypothetical protein
VIVIANARNTLARHNQSRFYHSRYQGQGSGVRNQNKGPKNPCRTRAFACAWVSVAGNIELIVFGLSLFLVLPPPLPTISTHQYGANQSLSGVLARTDDADTDAVSTSSPRTPPLVKVVAHIALRLCLNAQPTSRAHHPWDE